MGIWRIVMETNRLSRRLGCPPGVSQPFQILWRFALIPLCRQIENPQVSGIFFNKVTAAGHFRGVLAKIENCAEIRESKIENCAENAPKPPHGRIFANTCPQDFWLGSKDTSSKSLQSMHNTRRETKFSAKLWRFEGFDLATQRN
jgi:hypothetical protein